MLTFAIPAQGLDVKLPNGTSSNTPEEMPLVIRINQADDIKHRQTIHNECVNIMKMANILGLMAESPGTYFQQKKEKVIDKASIDADTIEALILDRKDARKAKDFKKADEIRDQLKEMNIEIEDRPEGTVWKVLS